ncbi:MAG: GCN5-related N-acetyltransferase [Sediminibacterium sp.]|nr:GCN5-related N-acetyltransferase [Sediminibacterium sp.]
MNSTILIRQAVPEDIPSIQEIALKTWPATYGNLLSKEQLAYMLDRIYSTTSLRDQFACGHRFYIADSAGEPVGFASVSKDGGAVFKLNKLYILPGSQKTGTGKSLLNEVIGYAKLNGAHQLIVQVKSDNPARHFYEKQGFVATQEIHIDIGNGYFIDDLVMQKIISPG